ncbi:MAG: AAA family ATPase [Dehalococcoidia bacterium]
MSPQLILFGGPAGAGKSTLAWAWCNSRPRSVQIELDQVRASIVGGYIDPGAASPEQAKQYEDSVRAACALARSYLSDGYDVTIDDLLYKEAYESIWLPALGEAEASVLILLPDLSTTLRRAGDRAKSVPDAVIVGQHHAASRWPASQRLDTSGMTVDESIEAAVRRGLLPG